ncbi:MAG: hypothetical protein LBQ82_06315 [Treponema sp.]|jgi:hypothetical protein|nr:hypothetical protein [Treponema sp.]
MVKKTILIGLVALIAGVSALYAQSNTALKNGVYRATFMTGEAKVVFNSSEMTVTVWSPDGNYVVGRARIVGTQVNVDYGNAGFDTWTIVNDETFKDINGFSYIWVRAWRTGEAKRR